MSADDFTRADFAAAVAELEEKPPRTVYYLLLYKGQAAWGVQVTAEERARLLAGEDWRPMLARYERVVETFDGVTRITVEPYDSNDAVTVWPRDDGAVRPATPPSASPA